MSSELNVPIIISLLIILNNFAANGGGIIKFRKVMYDLEVKMRLIDYMESEGFELTDYEPYVKDGQFKMLFKKSIIEDHWNLFPVEKKWDLEKKSASNFESTTWVKVVAKSLWQTLRWANTFDMENEMSARPTLLVLDDIDVLKSVMNMTLWILV